MPSQGWTYGSPSQEAQIKVGAKHDSDMELPEGVCAMSTLDYLTRIGHESRKWQGVLLRLCTLLPMRVSLTLLSISLVKFILSLEMTSLLSTRRSPTSRYAWTKQCLFDAGELWEITCICAIQALNIALDNMDKVMAKVGSDKEALEGVLGVMCWLVQRVIENNTAPAEAVALVDKLVAKLTADSSSQPLLRVKT